MGRKYGFAYDPDAPTDKSGWQTFVAAVFAVAIGLTLLAVVAMTCGGCAPAVAITPATLTLTKTTEVSSVKTHETYDRTKVSITTPAATDRPAANIVQTMQIIAATQPVKPVQVVAPKPAAEMTTVAVGETVYRVPAGSTVDIKIDKYEMDADPCFTVRAIAESTGNGVNGSNIDKMDISKLTPPEASMDSLGNSTGNAGGLKGFKFKGLAANGTAISLYIIGGVLIVGGIILWLWLKMQGLGIAMIVGGIALIGCGVLIATYPWVFLIPVGLAVCGVVWFLFYARSHGGLKAAFNSLVLGVQTSPAAAVTKTSVAAAASTTGTTSAVTKLVKAAKVQLVKAGLLKTAPK